MTPPGFQPMKQDNGEYWCFLCKAKTDHTTRQHRDKNAEKLGKDYVAMTEKGYTLSQDHKEVVEKSYREAQKRDY